MKFLFGVLISALFLLSGIAPLILVTPVSAQNGQTGCPTTDTLYWTAIGGVPTSFNMLTASPSESNYDIIRMMYLGFAPYAFPNGTLDFSNSMTDWISANSNYTQWEFNVKPGLMWSNGQAANASDILNTYSRSFALNSTVDFLGLGSEVVRSYALNSSTAVFVLNKSDAHFPDLAGQSVYTTVYPSSFTQQGPAYSGINGTFVADGPFYVSNYASGDTQMVLLRNPYYKPAPTVCEVIMNFVESDANTPLYLKSGSTDYGALDVGSVSTIQNAPNLHTYITKAQNILYLMYNTSIFPYNQLAFRQALLYGVDQNQIASQAFFNYSTTAYNAQGGIPPETTAWYNPNQATYNFSQSIATSLLNSIGIKKGSDGYMQYPNGTDVSITIYAANKFVEAVSSAGIVQTNLNQLGFKTTLDSLANPVLNGLSNKGETSGGIIIADSAGPVFGMPYLDALPGPQVYILFKGNTNWEPDQNYQQQYQGNLTIIQGTDVPAQMKQPLNNIQTINAKDLPVIVLGYPDSAFGYSTARFTNWPSFINYALYSAVNVNGVSQLTPISKTSSTSTTSQITSTTTTSQTGQSSATTTSTKSSTGIAYPGLGVLLVLATIILVSVAFLRMRRWERGTSYGKSVNL